MSSDTLSQNRWLYYFLRNIILLENFFFVLRNIFQLKSNNASRIQVSVLTTNDEVSLEAKHT